MTIPPVLSANEVEQLLTAAKSLRVRVMLSLAYGCGLRAGEVIRLRAGDIDSVQSIIRIVQSKGRKDRLVMLPPCVLALSRQWWLERPANQDACMAPRDRWLFPGRVPGRPITTRQLNRLFHEAAEAGFAVVRPGITAHEVAVAENDVFRKHGYGEYCTSQWTRVRGHGMGLFADTKPHILEDVTTRIDAGMALIVHPNTYHPEVGYLVLGDAVVVTERGAEVLTRTPRELFEVPA